MRGEASRDTLCMKGEHTIPCAHRPASGVRKHTRACPIYDSDKDSGRPGMGSGERFFSDGTGLYRLSTPGREARNGDCRRDKRMDWLKRLYIILFAVCLPLGFAPFAIGGQQRMGATATILPYSAELGEDDRPEAPFDIREDIVKAQEFLSRKKSGYTTRVETARVQFRDRRGRLRERVIRKKIVEPVFLLAVEDLNKRTLRSVRFTSKGCGTEGFDVKMIRSNGVGSRFEVRHPDNMAVLALRTMVHAEGKGYEEVVYTPYCPEIDTRRVREDGLKYLKEQIESARIDLEERGVRLSGFEGLPVEVAPTDVSLVLSIIEHIDPQRFKTARSGDEIRLVREVLTIIGANTRRAYAYSKSSAGARGLFQFIPGTYEKIQRKYRRAGLHRDFVAGCTSHVNAAKASLLLFDSDLNDLPDTYLPAMTADARSVGRYLAAAYNCGSKRVERSARDCPDGWTCLLPEETRTYLNKFDAVWNLRQSLDK
jgi:hypothetical protein